MDNKDKQILEKILEEIEFLKDETKSTTLDELKQNERHKRVIAMTFINIGELARLFSKHSSLSKNLPIQDIINMRNVAAHGYYQLKFDVIWDTIKNDLPDLETTIRKILKG